jgi:hypothetical protein
MLTHVLLALTDNLLGNSGVFTQSYSRVFASGNYNNQSPELLNTTDRNNPNSNTMFSFGRENTSILTSNIVENEANLLFCEDLCSINPNCQGIFNYDVEPNELRNYTQTCNTLNSLGAEMTMESTFSSESYAKIISYTPNVESTSIEALILNINSYITDMFPYNTTVFIDLNNDGLLDNNEPYVNKVVYDYAFVEFNDLEPGMYHLRQIIHNETCAQVYPGIEGNYFFQANTNQDHFADRVINWKSSVHSHGLKGGHISSTGVVHYENPSLDYILGNNSTTFLSFCPEETITISFVDDVIHNTMGDDIIFNLFRDNDSSSSETWGDVFISFDNATWTYVGNVTYDDNVIDLTEYNYQGHANYLRIEFVGTNHMDFLNISSIELGRYTRYFQPFAITIDSSANWFGVFFNDCSDSRICGDFCNFNIFDNAEYFSCLYGCDSFDELRYCDCYPTQEKDDLFSEYYDDYNFSSPLCYQGCIYDMETHLGANYIAFPGRQGNSNFLMNFNHTNTTFLNRTSQGGYLSQVFDACDASSKCRGITVGEEGFSMYSDVYNRVDDPNTVFIVKLGPITSPTTTQTTSQTSTQTTSQSSTQTTSQTTTQTTSQTTTQTTSQTTTQTTSQTTSQTTPVPNGESQVGMSTAALTGVLVSIFLVLAVIAIYLFMINRKQKQLNNIEAPLNSGPIAFDNPVYDANMPETGNYSDVNVNQGSLYKDVFTDDYNEPDYLDVQPNNESPVSPNNESPVSPNSYDMVNQESDL